MIEADVLAEGRRLVAAGGEAGVPLKLLGGVAVRLHAEEDVPPALRRECPDIDVATAKGLTHPADRLLRGLGYEPHVAFNALHGRERMLFYDGEHGRKLDVFVGSFRMCHAVPFSGRLDADPLAIPLAELLLTKLQVVELNEKDVRDMLALLCAHPVGERDEETINGGRIAQLCAADWGLWRTVTWNLERIGRALREYALPAGDAERIGERVGALAGRIEREPKSRAWKLRDRIGVRKRWYELPEEPE